MEESIKAYNYFLTYDQLCSDNFLAIDGIEYGFTHLLYYISESTLFIKKIDPVVNSENEFEFTLKDKNLNYKTILDEFLVDYLANNENFSGTPLFIKSDVLNKETFEIIYEKALEIKRERKQYAILSNLENELIKYCKSIHLNPQPEGNSPNNWRANCPSGGNHSIMIYTKTNLWGCGYCRKKGDLNSLKARHQEKK